MFTVEEIRTWSIQRIQDEIEDQRRWVREAQQDGSFEDFSLSNEYISRLRQVLYEKERQLR